MKRWFHRLMWVKYQLKCNSLFTFYHRKFFLASKFEKQKEKTKLCVTDAMKTHIDSKYYLNVCPWWAREKNHAWTNRFYFSNVKQLEALWWFWWWWWFSVLLIYNGFNDTKQWLVITGVHALLLCISIIISWTMPLRCFGASAASN